MRVLFVQTRIDLPARWWGWRWNKPERAINDTSKDVAAFPDSSNSRNYAETFDREMHAKRLPGGKDLRA